MYIPQGFFGTQGSCFRVTTSSITGSGLITTGSFVSGGVIWDYYQFEMTNSDTDGLTPFTASLNVLSGSTGQAKVLIVGGGGSSGRRQVYFTPQGSSITYQNDYPGGGGAGGVVYYDNFPLASGSYEIGVASATPGTTGASGSQGKDSYIKLPNNFVYTPFTTNYLIAEGGGAGGTLGYYRRLSPPRSFYYALGPYGGGSGGGAGSAIDGSGEGGQGNPNPNGGLNGQFQGYRGGLASGVSPSTGGGGAGGAGIDSNPSGNTRTDGGVGIQYNLTGTLTYYAGGGAGAGRTPGLGTLGRGGAAPSSIGANGTNGQGGVVIIAIPKCFDQRTQCRTYTVRAGSSNSALVTYYPCGVNTLTSSSLAPGNSGSICTYVIGGYPTISGVGSQITASVTCSTDIELPATCPSGTQLTNLHYYQYSNTTTGSGGSRAYGNASYYNAAGTLVVADNFAYENPTQYFCAREVPQPFISSGSGILLDLGVGGCGDYCTSSYAPPTPFPPFPYNCNCYSFTAGGDGPGPEPGFVGGLDCITGQYVGFSGNSTNRTGGSYCWRTGTPSGAGTFSLSGPLSNCTGGAC